MTKRAVAYPMRAGRSLVVEHAFGTRSQPGTQQVSPMLNTLRRRARSGQMETPAEFQPCSILEQERFLKALHVEQKRTERSRRPFVLMLLESDVPMGAVEEELLERVVGTLAAAKRETDELGWYRHGSVLGVIFTEIAASEGRSIAKVLRAKISAALSQTLDSHDVGQFKLSFHLFPEDWQDHDRGIPGLAAAARIAAR